MAEKIIFLQMHNTILQKVKYFLNVKMKMISEQFSYGDLKELRNYKRKYFCVRHKNRPKHNQHFETTAFHNKFTLCHIKPNIYI